MQHLFTTAQARDLRGLTLIELMITLALAAVLTTMAMASFQEITAQNHATAETQRLISSIFLARTEALRRNQRVVICRSANPDSLTCAGGTSGDWATGWLVFVDNSRNGQLDTGEELLLVAEAIKGAGDSYVFLSSATNVGNFIQYLPNGRYRDQASSTTGASFVFCKKEYRSSDVQRRARAVVLNNAGRPKIIRHADMAPAAQAIVDGNNCKI